MVSVNKKVLPIFLMILCCFLLSISKAQNNNYFYSGDNTSETEFNNIPKSVRRITRDIENLPDSFSLKDYAPVPGFQGNYGTCVAWSTGYAARTISYCIQHNITDKNLIKTFSFSPNYLYFYVKNPADNTCEMGAKIEPALKILSNKGDLLLSENIPDCVPSINNAADTKAKNFSIKAYSSLNDMFGHIRDTDINKIKKCLTEKKPVIFSITCWKSLFNIGTDGVWNIPPNDSIKGNHALCIVGYDNKKLGGAFEVMNSWGTGWGNQGFFWITYQQLKTYGTYALELMDKEVYDGSASNNAAQPQLKGKLSFIIVNDYGNDIDSMPVVRNDINSSSTENNKISFCNYTLKENYSADTKFKIKFTTNAPAFVYIFSVDDKKKVSKLFPYADNVSAAINSTNATVYFPFDSLHFKFGKNSGKDKICVLYSKSAIDFYDLKENISNTQSNMYQSISKQFDKQIIPLKRISFSNNIINFSTNAAEDELVCFFIDLNHK